MEYAATICVLPSGVIQILVSDFEFDSKREGWYTNLYSNFFVDQVCCNQMRSLIWFQPKRFETLGGSYLLSAGRNRLRIGGAFVSQCDNLATNGILHGVDRPIMRRRVTSISDMLSGGEDDFNLNIDWPF